MREGKEKKGEGGEKDPNECELATGLSIFKPLLCPQSSVLS